MRIFFPGLLLLVALIVFVISTISLCAADPTWFYFLEINRLYNISGATQANIDASSWDPGPWVLNLLLSAWAAAWAWKEIQRVKMGRAD